MRCFIAGTDTGIGKTFFTAALLRRWVRDGYQPIGIKPVSTGTREDAELLREAAATTRELDEINPFHFERPLSPWISAHLENRSISVDQMKQKIHTLVAACTPLAVEGTGGWLTPVSRNSTMADLARDLGFPVVIVARPTLGTLNHTLLTIESVRSCGLSILGLVINWHGMPDDLATRTNPAALEDLTGLPQLSLQPGQSYLAPLPSWLTPA